MKRLIWIVFLGGNLLFYVCGCGSEGVPFSSDGVDGIPEFELLEINPAETDSAVSPTYGNHFVGIDTTVSMSGKLFLFLPGTQGQPKAYQFILQTAARSGFHAVGLAYPNDRPVGFLCVGADNECPGNIHEEVLTGNDVSMGIDVSRPDCIENRLVKLLLHLTRQYPEDGWGQFLGSGDTILWDVVRVAGHSQGGATAGYIGKRFSVDRVTFFSSPYDIVEDQVAAWLSIDGATAAGRYYGFSHLQDSVVPWSAVERNWPALAMDRFGTYVKVDDLLDENRPNFGGSHMLSTDWPPTGSFSSYHNMTIADLYTPLDSDGRPTYLRVWWYLCFL